MAEQDSGLFWRTNYSAELEAELSPQEKALRDKFVSEYLRTFSPREAAIRCGFRDPYAEQYAQRFMREPYVHNRIEELKDSVKIDDKEFTEKLKQEVINELRYLMKVGSFASRTSAAAKLAVILDMDAPIKTNQTITHRGGVMAVPGVASLEEWEKAAESSQTKLVQETRE